jgi:hypothetical protein
MKTRTIIFSAVMLFSLLAKAQGRDTITIDAKKVRTANLQTGTNRYLVYFRNEGDSNRTNFQFWTRKIDYADYEGRKAISVTQVWEDSDTVIHKVYTVCDDKTFQTLFQESWWRKFGTLRFDFLKGTASFNDAPVSQTDTAAARKKMFNAFQQAQSGYVLNWHLDLEVFSILPLKANTTYRIRFYDPGFAAPQDQFYTVSGSSKLSGYNKENIDCWLLTYESANNHEVFWISKKTHEVLKLEQKFGNRYRYKIKLANAG